MQKQVGKGLEGSDRGPTQTEEQSVSEQPFADRPVLRSDCFSGSGRHSDRFQAVGTTDKAARQPHLPPRRKQNCMSLLQHWLSAKFLKNNNSLVAHPCRLKLFPQLPCHDTSKSPFPHALPPPTPPTKPEPLKALTPTSSAHATVSRSLQPHLVSAQGFE